MTEIREFIHLLRRSFPTPFRLLILSTALLQKMLLSHTSTCDFPTLCYT